MMNIEISDSKITPNLPTPKSLIKLNESFDFGESQIQFRAQNLMKRSLSCQELDRRNHRQQQRSTNQQRNQQHQKFVLNHIHIDKSKLVLPLTDQFQSTSESRETIDFKQQWVLNRCLLMKFDINLCNFVIKIHENQFLALNSKFDILQSVLDLLLFHEKSNKDKEIYKIVRSQMPLDSFKRSVTKYYEEEKKQRSTKKSFSLNIEARKQSLRGELSEGQHKAFFQNLIANAKMRNSSIVETESVQGSLSLHDLNDIPSRQNSINSIKHLNSSVHQKPPSQLLIRDFINSGDIELGERNRESSLDSSLLSIHSERNIKIPMDPIQGEYEPPRFSINDTTEDQQKEPEIFIEPPMRPSNVQNAALINWNNILQYRDYQDFSEKYVNNEGKKINIKYCSLCDNDRDIQIFSVIKITKNCSHFFCNNCIKAYIIKQLEISDILKITCPRANCTENINHTTIRLILENQALYNRYVTQYKIQSLRSHPHSIVCPQDTCFEVLQLTDNEIQCQSCQSRVCNICYQLQHLSKFTHENRCLNKFTKFQDQECFQIVDHDYEQSQSHLKSKECPSCYSQIQKVQNLNRMLCWNCNYTFCWICSRQITPEHYSEWNIIFGCPGLELQDVQEMTPNDLLFLNYKRIFRAFKFILILCLILVLYPLIILVSALLLPLAAYQNYYQTEQIDKCRQSMIRIGMILLGIVLLPIWIVISIAPGTCFATKAFINRYKLKGKSSNNAQ